MQSDEPYQNIRLHLAMTSSPHCGNAGAEHCRHSGCALPFDQAELRRNGRGAARRQRQQCNQSMVLFI